MLLLSVTGIFAFATIFYFVATDVRPDTNYRLAYVIVEVAAIGLILSMFGQTLSDESTKFGDTLYHCPWIYWNQQNKKALLIILVAIRPLQISFFNLITVNHQILIRQAKLVYTTAAVALKIR
uniref:Uncharacterized protein LOC114328710 n=1 Tax=Diabrotica virgifera virgifera TaxID=50390 RepID=A0A6P7FKG4_DIAVI